ncbi:MAG: VWA domain-containing protein [ANME-2 cluster archaeon]|jgi:Mg-chelatase subunit ChlD|nr:VWA domain-containing protein [ANME-2 cluster archaeon]
MTASVPIAFENIEYLLGVLPVIVIGWVLIHKGARRSLILSRIIIVSLLVVALAGPYNPVTVTEINETPTITVLSDETESMDIFESGTAEEIFDKLQDTTPARMEKMGGLRSDIGDEILASSTGDDHIIVVSDGNNNFGSDLAETIDFVSGTGTVVYAITQTPKENDLSVEITGARTAVLGNENLVGVEVRQAKSNTTYKLSIEVDGSPVSSQTVTQTKPIKIVGFSSTFQSLGPHLITARISSGDDMRSGNNVFNKTIYVVPKPRLLLVSPDDDSPLYKVLRNLYETNTVSSLDDANLTDYKAVVLDNINDGRLSGSSIGKLREYTAGGGGLLVVGGDNSYDFGDYLDSSIEAILPVESYSSAYAGSVNVVLVLDISGSISAHEALDVEKAMAINLLNDMGRDTNVGVVAYGGDAISVSDGLLPMSSHANRDTLKDKVSKLKTGYGGTSMDEGISTAADMLDNTSGQKYMLVFSDGAVKDSFEDSKIEISGMDSTETEMIFVMIKTNVVKEREVKTDNNRGDYFLKVLADQVGGDFIQLELDQRLDLTFGQESPDLPEDGLDAYAIVRLDEEHFITRYLNISGSVSGYNDVTQKVGARRLVTTSMGKPVVTVWEFGLGRVVSLSSDNGNMWAGALYSGENARLLPSMVNWAVGDPRPEGGIVVYSGDMNLGSPGTVIIRSNEMPAVVFGKQDVPVSQTGERTYEGVIEPEHIGLFTLQVSAGGVTLEDTAAVNYPLEYRDVGNDPDFLEAVKHSGGRVYNVDQAESLLFSDIRKNSIMTSEEHVSLSWLFLITALLVFLGEVIMRRAKGIIEIKTRRKGRGR